MVDKVRTNKHATLEILLQALKDDLPLEIHGDGYITMIGTDGVLDIVNKYCEYDCLVHNLRVAENRLDIQYKHYLEMINEFEEEYQKWRLEKM